MYGDCTNVPDYFAKEQEQYHYTVVGSLTNTAGYLSGYSASNYIKAINSFAPSTNMWELQIAFKTGSNVTTNQSLCGSLSSNYDSISVIITSSSKFEITPCFTSSAVGFEQVGTHTVLVNTEYVVKIRFTGSAYQLDYGTDGGQTFTSDINKSSTSKITTGSLIFGMQSTSSAGSLSVPFLGGINPDNCYIKINDEYYWQGQTTLTPEEAWQQSVTDYGVCGKFVYDRFNNTVRLPKYSSKIYTGSGSVAVTGDGTKLGLLNLSNNTNYNLTTFSTGNGYGLAIGNSGISTSNIGVATDATKSGLIANLSNITASLEGYYYNVIATTTKTDIEVDVDEIATDLNSKADVDLSNMNASQSERNTIVNWVMPDYANGIGLSGSLYTAPSDGFVTVHPVGGVSGIVYGNVV